MGAGDIPFLSRGGGPGNGSYGPLLIPVLQLGLGVCVCEDVEVFGFVIRTDGGPAEQPDGIILFPAPEPPPLSLTTMTPWEAPGEGDNGDCRLILEPALWFEAGPLSPGPAGPCPRLPPLDRRRLRPRPTAGPSLCYHRGRSTKLLPSSLEMSLDHKTTLPLRVPPETRDIGISFSCSYVRPFLVQMQDTNADQCRSIRQDQCMIDHPIHRRRLAPILWMFVLTRRPRAVDPEACAGGSFFGVCGHCIIIGNAHCVNIARHIYRFSGRFGVYPKSNHPIYTKVPIALMTAVSVHQNHPDSKKNAPR